MTGLFLGFLWAALLLTAAFAVLSDSAIIPAERALSVILAPVVASAVLHLLQIDSRKESWRESDASSKSQKAPRWWAFINWARVLGLLLALGLGVLAYYLYRFVEEVHRGAAAFVGLLTIVLTMAVLQDRASRTSSSGESDSRTSQEGKSSLKEWWFMPGWIIFAGAVVTGWMTGEVTDLARAGTTILLGTLTALFGVATISALHRDRALVLESNWGGLGGGNGGWRFSLAIVLAVLTVSFAGATVMVVQPPRKASPESKATTTTPAAGQDTTAAKADNKGKS